MAMPRHNDVLYLVAQYLQATGLYASSLALQQESGLDVTWLRGGLHEVALLRRWVFAGDVTRARALLQPLKSINEVSEEFTAALLALDELEILMKTQFRGDTQSRLAQVKLKCFEKLVPLFRAPVDVDESDVFKYVAMPKLQLVGLIRDAVLFHRQIGDGTARDCISVTSIGEDIASEEEHDGNEILLLDKRHNEVLIEETAVVPEDQSVAHSVEWTMWQKQQRNPMAFSMNLDRFQWQEDDSEGIDEDFIQDVKETADAAVSCEIDVKIMVDATVSCELDTKETVDAGVNCAPEEKKTADVAVSCGSDACSDVATQTESIPPLGEIVEEHTVKDNNCGERVDDIHRIGLESNNSIVMKAEADNNQRGGSNLVAVEIQSSLEQLQTAQREQIQQALITSPAISSQDFTASWAQQSSNSLQLNPYPENGEPQQKQMFTEDILPPEQDNFADLQHDLNDELDFDVEIPTGLKGPPLHYDELKLDHVVCAGVIAEVKEPQAVRALDVHPTGNHFAVGTNARALRIFNLSTPLQQRQQRQQQLSWSSPQNMILPLLPVTLERHKHHDSGIYCVSYNHHLLNYGDTSMVASGAADGSVKVLITKDRDPLQKQQADEFWIQRGDVNGLKGKTRALEFSSPHLLWTTSTNDRRLSCWDVQRTHKHSNSGPFQTLDGHVGEIQTIAMPHSASTSTLLLSAALDKTVRLWDTRSRRCERLVTSGEHAAFALHFHPSDDKLVVSGHQDGSVSLWDLRSTAREALQIIVPHQDECRSVRWSPEGQWLLSAAFDGTICIMQVSSSTLQPVASYHKHYGKVLQAQWHPTEPAFVSSGADKRVKLWAFA
ncbi:hypothetical protein F444_09513 [Phytophthora nicotianae P1976]|uniref:LisH domain-containing protein n=1 Tax=Phytophthora nicotianae P1976 TaxID=1317066 RepID=A0A081A7H0_PHYNI|nr:hypothetical protein F444_09513 [Phytophthora nicotianae P1976]